MIFPVVVLVVLISAQANAYACVDDCSGLATGYYQSCLGCDVYAGCVHGSLIDNLPCPAGLVWDDGKKACDYTSSTCAPQTEAPQTEAPQTEAPQTEAPQTEAPQTEAPQTEAPQTVAPQTEAPQTEAPQTEAPQTEAPQTEAPQTEAPQTESPQTEAPQTEAPQTESPQTEAPQTLAPQTEAPQTEAPQTESPQTEAPQTEAPQTEAPQTEAPQTEAPQTEAPHTEAPQTEAPQTESPQTEAPQTEAPQTEAPQTEAPQTDAPQTEAPQTEAPTTKVPEDEDILMIVNGNSLYAFTIQDGEKLDYKGTETSIVKKSREPKNIAFATHNNALYMAYKTNSWKVQWTSSSTMLQTKLPAIHSSRYEGAFMFSLNNNVYVAGGRHYKNSVEMLKLNEEIWTTHQNKLPVGVEYTQRSGAVLGGAVYMIGGVTRDMNYADYVYSWTGHGSWRKEAPLKTGRSEHCVVAVGNKLYAIGGIGREYRRGTELSSVEIYDARTRKWSAGPALPRALSNMACVRHGENILVLGGWTGRQSVDSIYVLDTTGNKWRKSPQTLHERMAHHTAAIINL